MLTLREGDLAVLVAGRPGDLGDVGDRDLEPARTAGSSPASGLLELRELDLRRRRRVGIEARGVLAHRGVPLGRDRVDDLGHIGAD